VWPAAAALAGADCLPEIWWEKCPLVVHSTQ
jgi:hypothetical protein